MNLNNRAKDELSKIYSRYRQIKQEAQLPQRNSASAAHTCAADALFLCGSSIGIGRS